MLARKIAAAENRERGGRKRWAGIRKADSCGLPSAARIKGHRLDVLGNKFGFRSILPALIKMAVLEIRKFNDPILRQRAEEVREINEATKRLIDTMAETMEKNQGVGLAAPQIGISKRIIVMERDAEESRVLALINPRIVKKSAETDMQEEGCLSFPDIFLAITRAQEVEVEGLDRDGRKITIQASGLVARIFQHEIDHIDGILFFNRLSFIEKIKFKLKHSSIKL